MFDIFQKLLLFGLVPILLWHFYKSKKYYPIYFFLSVFFGVLAEAIPGPNLTNLFEGSWLQIFLFMGFMIFFAIAPVIHKQRIGDRVSIVVMIPWVVTLVTFTILVGMNLYVKFNNSTFETRYDIEAYALIAFLLLSLQSAIIVQKEIREEFF